MVHSVKEQILYDAQCQGAGFSYAQCQGADFFNAQCQGADFRRCIVKQQKQSKEQNFWFSYTCTCFNYTYYDFSYT